MQCPAQLYLHPRSMLCLQSRKHINNVDNDDDDDDDNDDDNDNKDDINTNTRNNNGNNNDCYYDDHNKYNNDIAAPQPAPSTIQETCI